ncbi:hypothetical protein NP493_28g01022 [Ridgeia piscesae]|uniref:G-protein coupled receptors family 1 profile domain-containing protein n=1 Tax=Ridgeia piscesae TaxID=27915 RepID=A0AAD9PCW3_RIDPI|nr:hypothetical protein NP493_28g01022 [Ridgeia piscesae]
MYVHYERTLLVQRIVNGKKLSVAAGSRVKLSRWYILNDTVTFTPIVRKTDHFGRGQRPDALKHAPREDDDQGRASSAERKLIARHLWSVTHINYIVMDLYEFSDVKPAIISTVIVLNIITNPVVIAVLARYPALREDRTSLFIFTMCVADLAGGCTAMPISAALCSSATPNIRLTTQYLPKIQMFCFWWFGFNSTHSVTWVALSKMVAILKPFRYEQLLARNRCYGIIAFNWVVGAALAAAKLTFDTTWNMSMCTYRSPANNKHASRLILSTYLLGVIIPAATLIVATFIMLIIVLRTHRQISTQVQSIGGGGAGSSGAVVSAGYLQGNVIQQIEPFAFSGLASLRVLDLSHQQLTSVPRYAFTGLRSLYNFDISHNQIRVIDNNVFHGLPALRSL